MLYKDAIQQPLELIPAQATHICGPFSFVVNRGMTYYYNYLSPVDCHPRDDRPAMLLRSHVRVGDLPVERQPEALPPAKRLFTDLVRMIGYRAETRMMPLVGGDSADQPTARRLLRTLLSADANLIPDDSQSVLRVELLGLANGATERALRPVLDELNRSRTCYPGTELRMVYDIAR